jgi:hypothetical protein
MMNRNIVLIGTVMLFIVLAILISMIYWPVPEEPSTTRFQNPTPLQSTDSRERESLEQETSKTSNAESATWDKHLANILAGPGDTSSAARALIAALPGLPEEAQQEYIAHALNLCGDGDFPKLEKTFLSQATPASVVEAIFNESLNRPLEIKLPLLARTLSIPSHPMFQESREILELHLELEPSANPPACWDKAVTDHLSRTADGSE